MKEITLEDLALIDEIFEDRKSLFVELCQGKINDQAQMVKGDELISELRDVLEKYNPQI